jgi:hypothetical protein
MKPNTMTMLDLSTGHLSLQTREWLEEPGNAASVNVTPREHGYFVPAYNGEDLPDADRFPLDLLHCARYAGANGAAYVLFDTDADRQPGLPWYEDENVPDLSGTALSDAYLVSEGYGPVFVGDGPVFVNPAHVLTRDLVVERTWTETIEDGDYEAPDGAWIGTGAASVRVRTDEVGDLHLSVFGRGAEMDGPVAETSVRREDLEESARAANEDVPEP